MPRIPTIDISFYDEVTVVLPPMEDWSVREAVQRTLGMARELPDPFPEARTVLPGIRLLRLRIDDAEKAQTYLIRSYHLSPSREGSFSYLWLVVESAKNEGPAMADFEQASLALRAPNVRHQLGEAASPDQFRGLIQKAGRPVAPKENEGGKSGQVVGRTGFLFGGVIENVSRKLGYYASDFTDGFHPKVVASVLFMFFACLAPAIAFGGLIAQLTGGAIGAMEMIVATTVCGVIYALFSGQPLTILGSTGPVVIFIGLLFDLCSRWEIPFLPTLAWVGLWTSAIVITLAATEASRLINLFTRFTDEIFAGLISLIFIVEAVGDTVGGFRDPDTDHDSALLSLLLALGTYVIARELSGLRSGAYLPPKARQFLADFGPTIAIAAMTAVALSMDPVELATLNVPDTFTTTSGRPWLVDLWAAPAWVIGGAVIPALLVSLLLFLDQNITVRLVNNPSNRLEKGGGYHLDLLMVGILVAVCSLFGLPWMVAATVRSLNHVQSLADFGKGTERHVVSVRENRLSGLLIHLMVGISLLFLGLLQQVPMPVLFGLFFYMGVGSLRGNQMFDRVRLWFTDPTMYPDTHYLRRVPAGVVHKFTVIQAALLAILWAVKVSAIGILFPLVIAMLVPIRFWLARFFNPMHLASLDGEEQPEQERYREIGP